MKHCIYWFALYAAKDTTPVWALDQALLSRGAGYARPATLSHAKKPTWLRITLLRWWVALLGWRIALLGWRIALLGWRVALLGWRILRWIVTFWWRIAGHLPRVGGGLGQRGNYEGMATNMIFSQLFQF